MESRVENLRRQGDALLFSLSMSFKRELTKLPSKIKTMNLVEFLAPTVQGDALVAMTENAAKMQNGQYIEYSSPTHNMLILFI